MSAVAGPDRMSVTVDLEAVRRNVATARRLVGASRIVAVVKSDGYGHGMVRVAREAVRAGAAWLGVAFVDEGVRLREALQADLPQQRIMVFAEPASGEEEAVVASRLTPSVSTADGVARLARAAARLGRTPRVHVEVDTGLRRYGAYPEDVPALATRIAAAGLVFEGLWTHFATADEVGGEFLRHQLAELADVRRALRRSGIAPSVVHAANSAAALRTPESHFDLVRLGALLYGLRPAPVLPGADMFVPALTWTSRVAATRRVARDERVSYGLRYRMERDGTTAVVPVGFADGLSRLVGNRGQVIIRGERRPIAGAVGMDSIVVDCGDADVAVGDPVVLLGGAGDHPITAEELAQWCAGTTYEVVTRIAPALPRGYRGARSDAGAAPTEQEEAPT